MLKLAVVVLVVAAASVLAAPLHRLKSGAGMIAFQRCANPDCTGTCNTTMLFQENQCHPDQHFLSHGEIMRCVNSPASASCFRETIYDDASGAGCTGSVVFSAPRECNQCVPEPLSLGKFLIYQGCGTVNFTVSRGCDWGCKNCDVTLPLQSQVCTRFPHIPFLQKFAFEIGTEFSCGGSGWQEVTQEHFMSPVCDGFPDFVDRVFVGLCYQQHGFGFQFLCQ